MELKDAISRAINDLNSEDHTPPLTDAELIAIARVALVFGDKNPNYDRIITKEGARIFFAACRIFSAASKIIDEQRLFAPPTPTDTIGKIGATDPLQFEDPYRPRHKTRRRR